MTTDFGLKDPYAAEMKAAILGISPDVTIVDITHEIAKFDIRLGAFVMASVVPYLPKGTVNVGVVDPGVGTVRRSILFHTKRGFFVGPDNGLLVPAAESQGIIGIHEITNYQFMLPEVSKTFHGRDVFAPVAAHLANGVSPAEFGPEIYKFARPDFGKVTLKRGKLVGEVLHVDNFGNIVTNLSEKEVKRITSAGIVDIELPYQKLKLKFGKTYSEVESKEALALIGSHGYLEIAINQGSAARVFKTNPRDKIKLHLT